MARPYQFLRGLISASGETQAEAAKAISLGSTAFSLKLNNKAEWTAGEMYALMNRYGQDHSKLNLVFPMNGRNDT